MKKSLMIGAAFAVITGFAAPAFVEAQGVWAKGREKEMNLSLRFEAVTQIAAGAKSVIVRATGCSVFRLRVNGEFAGYGPARGPKGVDRVDEWEVTKFVRAGKNVFEFDVAGYNVPNYYLPNQPSYLRAEIVADGRILAATGTDAFQARRLNRVQKISRYSYQRPFSEAWNASEPVVGETLELAVQPAKPLLPRRAAYPTFAVNRNAKKFAQGRARYDAKAKTRDYWALAAAPQKDPRGFAKAECEIIPSYEAERYLDDPKGEARTAVYDFGLLDCGFVGVKASAAGKGRVLVLFDEVLTDGKIDFLRGGTGNVVLWDIDKPGELELESFEPYAFRYAKFIIDGPIEISSPYIRTYKSPSADGVVCPVKDPELKRIFEAARETFKQNALDVFTDCPGRERAGWLCDSYFTARVSKYFTGSLDLEELFLENFLLADCPDIPKAMFPMCYPADHLNGNFIPNWAMWLVLELREYAKVRGGDPALVKRFEPKVMALVEYLKTFENSDGLLEDLPKWVFVEWSECNSLTKGVNYPSNMTWARMLEAVAELYGRPGLAEKGAQVRETVVRQSFDGKWFRDQALRGADGKLAVNPKHTETCQYYAFYFGAATAKTHPELWKTLVEEFGPERKVRNTHPDVPFANAFIGNYLRLELLMQAGLKKKVEADIRGYFLKMADTTGTLWEHDSTTASCCHGFASYIALLLTEGGESAADPAFPDLDTYVRTVSTSAGEVTLAAYVPRLKVKAPALLLLGEERAADYADGTSGPTGCQWPVSVITAKGYAALALDCSKLKGDDYHAIRVAAVKAAVDALEGMPVIDFGKVAVIGQGKRAETAARAAAADRRIAYALANNPIRAAKQRGDRRTRDVWSDETAFDFAGSGAKTVIGYEMGGKSAREFAGNPAKFWRFGGSQLTGYDWLAYMDYLDRQGWKVDLAKCRRPRRFRVLAWNLEGQSQTAAEIASMTELVKDINPDALLIVENYGILPKLLKGLGAGWYGERFSMSLAFVSRWPIVNSARPYYAKWNYLDGSGPFNFGLAEIDVAGQHVRTCPLWIDWEPSESQTPKTTVAEVLEWELSPPRFANRRIDEISGILAAIKSEIAAADDIPLVIGGDFNGQSHRDWTEATKNLHGHNGLVVPWPVSKAMEAAGFVDTFRELNDPVENYGASWNRPGNLAKDWRIDFIYSKGAKLKPVASETFHALWHRPFVWRGKEYGSFPSDHGFVLTDFELETPPPEQYDNLPRGQ